MVKGIGLEKVVSALAADGFGSGWVWQRMGLADVTDEGLINQQSITNN